MRSRAIVRSTLCGLVIALAGMGAATAQSPVAYRSIDPPNLTTIDPAQITVSGISSGAFMAHQFHVAHSKNVKGVGIIAGGPYACSLDEAPEGGKQPSVWKGMEVCTAFLEVACPDLVAGSASLGIGSCEMFLGAFAPEKYQGEPLFKGPGHPGQSQAEATKAAQTMAAASKDAAVDAQKANVIDDIGNILNAKVYIFHGLDDDLLPAGVSSATRRFYDEIYKTVNAAATAEDLANYAKEKIKAESELKAAHAVIADRYLWTLTENDVLDEHGDPIITQKNINWYTNYTTKQFNDGKLAVKQCSVFDLGANFINVCSAEDCATDVCRLDMKPGEIDNAGKILTQFYAEAAGSLKPRTAPKEIVKGAYSFAPGSTDALTFEQWHKLSDKRKTWLQERLFKVDVGRLVPNLHERGLAPDWFLFVPPECNRTTRSEGEHPPCKLHIAFHGCLQNAMRKNDAYVRFAGYNEWADTNRIVVLYPQVGMREFTAQLVERASLEAMTVTVRKAMQHANPQSCWDLWGYTDADYYTQKGQQISAVAQVVNALIGAGNPLPVPSETAPE